MKELSTYLGYISFVFLLVAIAFRVNHYPESESVMLFEGILLSLYFPVYVLGSNEKSDERTVSVKNLTLAITILLVVLGSSLKLAELKFGSLLLLAGIICFCIFYLPLVFIQEIKRKKFSTGLILIGVIGLAAFPIGIFLRVYLGFMGGMQLFTVGGFFLALICLPLFLFDKSIPKQDRSTRNSRVFFTLIIVFILFFLLFRTVFPGKSPASQSPVEQGTSPANSDSLR